MKSIKKDRWPLLSPMAISHRSHVAFPPECPSRERLVWWDPDKIWKASRRTNNSPLLLYHDFNHRDQHSREACPPPRPNCPEDRPAGKQQEGLGAAGSGRSVGLDITCPKRSNPDLFSFSLAITSNTSTRRTRHDTHLSFTTIRSPALIVSGEGVPHRAHVSSRRGEGGKRGKRKGNESVVYNSSIDAALKLPSQSYFSVL